MKVMVDQFTKQAFPMLPATPEALAAALMDSECRVLFTGQPGVGKSTLVQGLAQALFGAGRECWCIGADPGSPLFGVPGSLCLGVWKGTHWQVKQMEALCTLDAGRFRLPLAWIIHDLP